MEKEEIHVDVSLKQLVYYVLLFIIPLSIAYYIAAFIGKFIGGYLQVAPSTAGNMLMVIFSLIIFSVLVPHIREKESVAGVRFTIIAVIVLGVGLAFPSIITKGDYSVLFSEFIYFGNYLLVTFVFCPEVLGIIRDLRVWFRHHGQLVLIFIYLAISLSYIFGFGTMYYDIQQTATIEKPFFYSGEQALDLWGHVYYSLVTFATLGYGEISPHATAARIVAGFEAILGMLINVVFIAILLTFISAGAQQPKEIRDEQKAKKAARQAKQEKIKKKRIQEYLVHQIYSGKRNINKYVDQIWKEKHPSKKKK